MKNTVESRNPSIDRFGERELTSKLYILGENLEAMKKHLEHVTNPKNFNPNRFDPIKAQRAAKKSIKQINEDIVYLKKALKKVREITHWDNLMAS